VADAELARERPALVEIEPPLPGLHRVERRAGHEDDLGAGIAPGLDGPGQFGRIIAVDEDQRLA
jgi:hypothetical protein